MTISEILQSDDLALQKALFQFSKEDSNEAVLLKFNLWSRHFFPNYFESPDADFHEDINRGNLDAYRGALDAFVDIAFRGAGKDVKTKLFIAFCVVNDKDHLHKYFKVLSEDRTNAVQSVTDIYNMLVNPRVAKMYPETFEKTHYKREETMSSFTTTTGIKVLADTIGTEQRGAIQDETRPDFIWFNDFESRKTLRSAVITKAIKDNMEEARTGLNKGGCSVYTCNYISEMGNVHTLVTEKLSPRKRILIIPILKDGEPNWERYTIDEINRMRVDDDDFEGERMCRPNASKDVYIDRELLDQMLPKEPIREIAGFKMFKEYNASHRYALGGDVAGGVGLDSSATVIIDFDTIPAQVVGTFHSNTILPEAFGDEMYSQANRFGGCLIAPENNKYDQAILKVKQLGGNLFKTGGKEIKIGYKPPTNYGWNTNSLTKSKMFSSLKRAVEDGLLLLNDKDLIQEAKSYTRNELIDSDPDPRLTTRHFDLLTACCIAWMMKDHAVPPQKRSYYPIRQEETTNPAL